MIMIIVIMLLLFFFLFTFGSADYFLLVVAHRLMSASKLVDASIWPLAIKVFIRPFCAAPSDPSLTPPPASLLLHFLIHLLISLFTSVVFLSPLSRSVFPFLLILHLSILFLPSSSCFLLHSCLLAGPPSSSTLS